MAKQKQRKASSGAPGISNGMGGPALNPIGLSNAGGGQRYVDATVAADNYQTDWAKFWADEKAVANFSQPVRSRQNGINEAGR